MPQRPKIHEIIDKRQSRFQLIPQRKRRTIQNNPKHPKIKTFATPEFRPAVPNSMR